MVISRVAAAAAAAAAAHVVTCAAPPAAHQTQLSRDLPAANGRDKAARLRVSKCERQHGEVAAGSLGESKWILALALGRTALLNEASAFVINRRQIK